MSERNLPPGWTWSSLADIGTWYGGGTPSKRNRVFWDEGTIPWLSPKDMGLSTLTGTLDHITEEAISGSSTKLVPAGSVALVVRSGILERKLPVAIVPFATTMNQDMKAVSPNEAVSASWLRYALVADEPALLRKCRKDGTTVASIDRTRLMSWQVPLPPLSEQHRIIEALEDHLSRLDTAEATLHDAETRLRSLMAMTIDYPKSAVLSAEDAAPPPTETDVVDGDLPQIPASWRWQRLGEIAEVVGGLTKDSKKQSDPALPLHPYLRVANVQAGYLDLDHITGIRATPAQVQKLTLQPGDVLLNEGGDRDKLGRGWIWEDQLPDCLHQNHVFRARVIDDQIDPRLIAWHANSFGRSWFIRNGKQSVNLASVSLRTIRSFPIPVPPPREQQMIVKQINEDLQQFERGITAIEAERVRSANLRRALLRAAFAGELVDQDPTDEPVTATLARLQDR